jgi:hypothetical protein
MSKLKRAVTGVFVAEIFGIVAAAGTAHAAEVQTTAADLLARYPGLHQLDAQGRPQVFFGMPMNEGATAEQAATDWLAQNDTAFGIGKLDLSLVRVDNIENRFTAFTYQQTLDGIPLEFSMVKIIVLDANDTHKVVFASAKAGQYPSAGLGTVNLTAEEARAVVSAMDEHKNLLVWSAPEMIAYMGEGDLTQWIKPRLVWRFTGELPSITGEPIKKTFIVDASNGQLMYARNEILNIDVTGQVRGRATPTPLGNAAADWSGNAPADRGIPGIRVRINGSNTNSVYTDANGNFTIPWTGIAPVTVDCSVADGRWVAVQEQLAGQALDTASASATPGTPVTLNLNPATSTQYTNAQLNAFLAQNATHDFWTSYSNGSTILNAVLPAKTTVSGTCNAFYDGTSTNFYPVGGSCNNTAFSSVVSHEYGHHIVNRLGLAQNGFGEGFGDLMSILEWDDVIVGRYFFTNGGAVRYPDTDNVRYPCTGCEVHTAGEVIGGIVTNLRHSFATKYNATALENLRQLVISWSRVTVGGSNPDSATPTTETEFLTVNDTDGNINNGTPDLCEIVAAFGAHGIALSGLSSSVTFVTTPATAPAVVAPSVSLPLTLSVSGTCRVPVLNTARVYWKYGTGAISSAPMTAAGTNAYSASITSPPCAAGSLQYYFSVNTQPAGGGAVTTVYFPSGDGGTTPAANTVSIASSSQAVSDDFEADRGWTVGPNTAISGIWTRVVPLGTTSGGQQVQPASDHSATGSLCFVTGQGSVGGAVGEQDIDGGFTTLISPAYNFAGYSDVKVSYWRWFSNGAGAGPYEDTFTVSASTNNGTTWTTAEVVGPGSASDPNVNGGWVNSVWTLSSKGLTPSSQIKLRFVAQDAVNPSLVEAALDDVSLTGLQCVDPTPCPADFNQDGGVDGSDVAAFFQAWQNGESSADVNQDGGVDGGDVATFFIAWQNGGC